jgi:hypothetical protein
MSVVERLNAAINAHDIEAFVALFAADYDSRQPAHPDRDFTGREQAGADIDAAVQQMTGEEP